MVVTDQISHKRVQDIRVDRVLLVTHCYSTRREKAAAQMVVSSRRRRP